jgi:outer membrane protein TolC
VKGQAITLEAVLQKALNHYPTYKQKELQSSLGVNSQSLLDYNRYPQAKITGQATYQSEVTKFDFPGIASPKPNNFNTGLDLQYPINDFDLLKTRKEVDQLKTSLGLTQIEVENQRLKERITALFGNILLQKENAKILELRKEELLTQGKKIATAVRNGQSLKSNQLVLEAEILATEEKLEDIAATLRGLTGELSLLTGEDISSAQEFQLPNVSNLEVKVERPEQVGFSTQHRLLLLQDQQLKQESKPHVGLFAQGFYGRPGYNFLKQNPRFFGITGIGLQWSINNYATQKTKLKSTALQQQLVEQQETSFQINLQAALLQKKEEINKYKIILNKDSSIVLKRKEILHITASQLENGAITSTEYLTELNATNMAELNHKLHEVQEAMAKVQYNLLTGH